MEGIALLGLLGVGYFLKDDKENDTRYQGISKLNGSENSVYDINNYKDSKNIESELANSRFISTLEGKLIDDSLNKSRNILNNNVANDDNRSNFVNSISGNIIPKDDFLRNDQNIKVEPFFSKAPTNINFDENIKLVAHQGGPQAFKPPKKETGQFFELQKNLTNVFGNTFTGPNSDQERYIPGNYRTNELPFQQELVSKIDEKNSVNLDVGHAYAQKNSVDNSRTINNPKLSYEGKVLGGKHNVDRRGENGEVFKHLPNQDYFQTADQWLVTTGAVVGKSNRPKEILKDTNRQYFNENKLGPAAPTTFTQQEGRPMVKKSTNMQYDADTKRNVTLENKSGDDNHNVTSYFAYPNERDKTTGRNHFSNFVSVFEAETMQVQDNIRPTIKETTNFSYNGDATHVTKAPSAIDQYNRADLNPNKEEISRGRYPTPESTKLTNGADTENVDIKKLETDYFNHYINNQDKLYTTIPAEKKEEFTKTKDVLDNVTLSDRLDPVMLNPFKTNPYTQSLSSYGYT